VITQPRMSIDTKSYWDGCLRNELRFQRCGACGEVVFHPRALCPYCLSDALGWHVSSGRGVVYSFTAQHVSLHPDRPLQSPRMLGIAALEEGFHMFTEFLTDDPALLRIDAPVVVVFDRIAEDLVLPKFRVLAA